MTALTPNARIAQTFARYGTPCGGIVCRRPWRGRNATERPPTSARKKLSDGAP